MTIPINVEDLQRQRKVDSNRMEFKKGGNPDRIYRSFCAFANDFGNIGGVYNLVATNTDRSIPMSDIQKGQRMVYYYHLNCRIGEFLKELSLTEGRNTSIPSLLQLQSKLTKPLSFLVRIPCHEWKKVCPPLLLLPKPTIKKTTKKQIITTKKSL